MASEDVECTVCIESKPGGEFVRVARACTHAPSVCKACVLSHLREEIMGKGKGSNVKCPTAGCECVLTDGELGGWCRGASVRGDGARATSAADDLAERFFHQQTQQALQAMADFFWCSRPTGCGAGGIADPTGSSFMVCYSCGYKTCLRHRAPWHEGLTCAEFDARAAADDKSMAWKLKNCKQCPGEGCARWIAKDGGCSVMRCCRLGDDHCPRRRGGACDHPDGCGQRFCWLCLGLIDEDGTRHHKTSCRQYFG
mmetsp:Transcript_12261/g.43048  ORF Transcript_12261/g.43048 Transcript_12261/m.43048 type:complete len:255 (-) Transcript_12261:88-852(-)